MKYSHHSAAVETKASTNAVTRAVSSGSLAVVAPVSTIVSPSAMITNSWNRSAKWEVCTVQVAAVRRGRPGSQ